MGTEQGMEGDRWVRRHQTLYRGSREWVGQAEESLQDPELKHKALRLPWFSLTVIPIPCFVMLHRLP